VVLRRDARAILDLPAAYRPEQLETAFRRAARLHHPDRGGDPRAFAEVVNAHRLLAQRPPGAVRVSGSASPRGLSGLLDALRRRLARRPPRVR